MWSRVDGDIYSHSTLWSHKDPKIFVFFLMIGGMTEYQRTLVHYHLFAFSL